MNSSKNRFDFGFDKVSAAEKTEKVGEIFDQVAPHYDLMNDIMSFGIHRLWKAWFVESLPLHEKGIYVDIAAGTGDVAEALSNRLTRFDMKAHLMAADINPAMIEIGKKRFPRLLWMGACAENLPFADNSIDVLTIAFGLRNITHRDIALKEFYRVLRPGGKFACLEFSQPASPLHKLYDFYSFHIIPKMGKWFAGNREAYHYLADSIRTFLKKEELLDLLKTIGFSHPKVETFTGGLVALHTGYK